MLGVDATLPSPEPPLLFSPGVREGGGLHDEHTVQEPSGPGAL